MSILDSVKGFMGMNNDDYDDYDDYEDYDSYDDYEEDTKESSHNKRSSSKSASGFFNRKSKVVPISGGPQVKISRPRSFDESVKIVDDLKSGSMVIFDVKPLDTEEARRIVDFVAGAAYGLDGTLKRVSGGIFVVVPVDVYVTEEELREKTAGRFDWSAV